MKNSSQRGKACHSRRQTLLSIKRKTARHERIIFGLTRGPPVRLIQLKNVIFDTQRGVLVSPHACASRESHELENVTETCFEGESHELVRTSENIIEEETETAYSRFLFKNSR